jgi:hypothetical protein
VGCWYRVGVRSGLPCSVMPVGHPVRGAPPTQEGPHHDDARQAGHHRRQQAPRL